MAQVDFKNMKKSWKTPVQLQQEDLVRARVKSNRRAEAMREFPGDIRRSMVAEDSGVANYLISQDDFCKRKEFAPATGKPDFDSTAHFFDEDKFYSANPPSPPVDEEKKEGSTPIDDDQFLRLDQSKLPIELYDSSHYQEKDKSPAEWLESNSGASALKYDGKEWKWRSVRVDSYDEENKAFAVTFLPSNVTKNVTRLNLKFDEEDEAAWERVSICVKLFLRPSYPTH